MNINKVSQSINAQAPDFIKSEYPLFNKFIEYYYRSQEKTGLGQNILNNFLQYLDIDKLNIDILDGKTKLVEPISATSDSIVVESIDQFLDSNGSILIGDEVIFYEKTTASPNIALSPGVSYDQVKLKWTNLASIIDLFDGVTTSFALTSQANPIAAPSAQHLIVSVYGEVLVPNVDYTVSGTNIVFTTAPRTRIASDDNANTYIIFLGGFIENTIVAIDNISNSFGEGKTEFKVTRNGSPYEPIVDEYVIAVYDNQLLIPKVDYYFDGDIFIFENAPLNGRFLSLYSIEAPIPSFGSGAVGYSRVNDAGELNSISINAGGSGYRFQYPPKVSINSEVGSGSSATALVNGVKNATLLAGGRGYSDTNPPTVVVESPTLEGSIPAELKATVTNGVVSAVEIVNSGSGYTFTPRVTFKQPGGAILGAPTVVSGSIASEIQIVDGGQGYTTAPQIYIDEPTGTNGIRAAIQAVVTNGVITSINVVNPGQGYETTPRIAVIDPVGAQVLQTQVDGNGRVISIELLSGGSGYDDVPSVYIVDNRTNGGTGATATAAIFNGQITDINITNFGSGYSADNPPQVIIQNPSSAQASVEIGLDEITGFKVNKSGSGYQKAKFEGCARAASGIIEYTESGNAVFSNNTTSASALVDAEVKCLDALFVKRLLDKYTEQFLPDIPELDYKKIDVRTAIKSVKDFYSTKGTSFSISYLFKLLYGEQVSISYPKDQIIKPSAATWSIDTILRATLVSGDPNNIKDGLLVQEADIADPNIKDASALVENYISIKTSNLEIYELVLSEETIEGTFTVPYKTKLAEPLDTQQSVITVDSTIGWPERNGEFIIGGTEVVQYKEKSLNQFIECTRSVNGVVEDWDSATEVSSNFTVYINKGTAQEVVLNVVGIVDAQQTTLTDTGSYYLPGDKLTVSKLGGTSDAPELKTWLYNVKKLLEVEDVQFGGIDNRFATITCSNPHGLLVGDQVTVYGANPIIYNGSFLVTSRDSDTVFQYQLPQPATVVPQGNILVSVDLNKGKSQSSAIFNSISPYTTNIQNSFFNEEYVYVASTGIPNYEIGPFPGSALLPGNQRKLNRFPLVSNTISTKNAIVPGPIGTWVNGVSMWSYKSDTKKTFGSVTSINITNNGSDYDAASPPNITISNGGGTGAAAEVTVNGSITEIVVDDGGSGYTSSPLVSIVGGGGSGAAATAIVTKGVVSRILMNNGGTGYTSQPSITIVGGGGTGATATASVRGPIKSISVTNGGSSYTSKPDVTLSSGEGAVAQAIVSNGRIISIAIISAGQGYTTAPEVTIQGDGFGAVARATIDTDGENAGRVTGIEIINRGINYIQGTTVINLTSVGSGATFESNVFQWTYNLQNTSNFDSAKGSVFVGFNNQYGGEYAHLSNPQRLRYILGDNLFETESGVVLEQEDQLEHSPIIGWAFDGNPVYGPYGYSDPTDQASEISRLNSSYRLKQNLVYNEITNPYPSRIDGPLLTEEPAGNFIEDHEYVFGLGDLDQYNGRFCKTPDFPEGRYCYFTTIDTTENGNPVFPYIIGPSFNSVVDLWNLNKDAIQQNIPTGVVRYRDPYENVDIDVERAPNASTNALTTEDGDILLFDVEDENRDGIISQDEIDDPDQLFEESPLQLFDYFPSVRFDSKVDIEVETTTKFEDASVTGFIVENPGANYQVDDILVFDNTNTDGIGVSARVSRITGEDVTAYSYETISDINYGVLTTENPHNIVSGDQVFVDYTPIMDNTNKEFVVRQFKGIEEIVIEQTGSGYDVDIPPTIIIDGDGESGELSAVVTNVGSVETVNIINSGSGYTKNPRVILSHPQVFKKADYYVNKIENNEYVKINDASVNANKELFVCGKTLDANGDNVAFLAKFSELGVKEWEKTLESNDGETYAEFLRLYVDGNDIWVVGENRPNSVILTNYNPDIILVKYEQSIDGLSASLSFQKGYAGISGSVRSDNITTIKKYSDSRYIIGGYTNTNSANPYDAFIASIDASGNFAAKRKIASASKSEKVTDLIVLNDAVYFVMETADSDSSNDIKVSFGKALIGTSVITIEWIKEINNTLYSFLDTSLVSDEFNECYISATLRLKSDNTTKDSFWVGKFDTDGDLIWNYRYVAPAGNNIQVVGKSEIDIFGDLNVAYNRVDTTTSYKTVDTIKLGYDGILKKQVNTEFNIKNLEGITANAITVDNSGDVYAAGQISWNRNEFIFEFAETDSATDKTGHYTPTLIGNDATDALALVGDGVAKLLGEDVANPGTWENAAIKFEAADLGTKLNDDWTLEFMLYKDAANSQTQSQTQQTLVAIGDATVSTGGLWFYYDMSSGQLELVVTNNTTSLNSAGSGLTSTQTNMFADNSWQFIALKKDGDAFTAYVNGIQIFTGTVSNTSLGNKDLYIGNIPGKNGTPAAFAATYQGQYYVDNLRLRNRAVTPTVPTDITSLPPLATYGLAYDWTDDAWFTTNLNRYDYIDYIGFGIKTDRNVDAVRLGTFSEQTATGIGFVRTSVTPVTGSTLTVTNVGYALGSAGLQSLDFDDATTTMQEDNVSLTYSRDIWSSRTATVPAPGSQKLKVNAVVKDRYYIKTTNTVKIDNIQELTINQDFNFSVGAKLTLNNSSGSFVNSGYILRVDNENNKVYLAVNNNDWSDDLNTGFLSTEQFDEQSTYGIVGPVPNDVNDIVNYTFSDVTNTTPGTFDIDLNDFNVNETYDAGNGDLDSFATFKPFDADVYSVRIEEVSGSSSYIVGSVVSITANDVSFNAGYTTIQVTNLTGVLKITLIATLNKTLQATAVANTDEVYIITSNKHYLSEGENIYVDGNPSQEVGSVVYDEYDGSFVVNSVVSSREFTYKLNSVAVTSPATTAANVNIFAKSPILKMYYGHQYLFDLSHSSMLGSNLSFSKDNLYKLEYSFNSIERIGTPGVTGEGQPTPTVKIKVDRAIVTNISYYFDPSRVGDDSPVSTDSYLDIVDSPYVGTFTISSTAGGTITTGDNIIKFPLINEPEGDANPSRTSYSTSSKKAVGPINSIRIVSPGGFYSKLPVVTDIQSTRQIERVQINEPGTEYAVGTYNGVPINGDGEGGLVSITVADGTDDEGTLIPGQIQKVVVTSPGKGYTTASVDIEAIDGILGPGLTGSGAELEVIIPPFGTGASIFTKGDKVGKIKKLKNNNFGYDYPHDYTLRPEITFPINAQLTSTSILDSITVTDPGSGYSQAPAVVITGGGGSGAIAEATIRNGRIEQIIVKDPGSGYSSEPTVELKSSFNYVVNLDLGLLQFAFPHGITNGSEVTLNVVDTGDGAEFPLASGALGRLNATTTYYAITGTANSLEDDQLKLAITAANAELGDAITFANAGTGRQQLLTSSFGAAAKANVITSTFLEGELVYQGDSFDTATATGYVSTNSGWQVGPRILKIVDYTGTFVEGQSVTGVISKSSGVISDLKIAKGVLEIGSITKTTGQFIDDVGKPSEIIQKIQDSYYYQDFSYAVKSSVSIDDWKDILIRNVHPASFKVFGELNVDEYGFIPNKTTDFELIKSVELAREAIVPNIQSFSLVEPIYSEFNNTEVLFRQKRLTSSENILTSVVQRIDDISTLFDGERIAFPLTVDGNTVVAAEDQMMIVLNGVAQTPGTSFNIQGDSIVFSEPPQPPASVKYVNITVNQIQTVSLTFTNQSGIFPNVGNALVGLVSSARLTVTSVEGNVINGYVTEGTFVIGENVSVGVTGFSANLDTITNVTNIGLFSFGETVTNLEGNTAKVEQINLERGQETPIAKLRYTIGAATTTMEVVSVTSETAAPVPAGTFEIGQNYQFGSEIFTINTVSNGSESTTITITRAQSGTASAAQQQDTPIYGTQIEVTNALTLSKTTGTYQSTPGLYDIVLDDVIIGASSGVVARVTSTATYQDPVTQEFIGQVNISEGSSFFGLLFNRITSATYPNIVLDDISKSQVSIVNYNDNSTAFNTSFPANEFINNYVIPYDNASGDLQEDEFIRNYKIEYGNNVGDFVTSEPARVTKITFKDQQGTGFFSAGQIIKTRDTKGEVIGYNQARRTIYLGKVGRILNSGQDYHVATFNGDAQLDTAQKKFGTASLLLDGTGDYLSIPTSTEFGFATGAFTIECWIRPTNVTGAKAILDFRTTGTEISPYLYLDGANLKYFVNGSVVITGTATLVADTWYHVTISRSGSTTRLFVDGVQDGGDYSDGSNYGSTKPLTVGATFGAADGFIGHIDEIRVSNTARYTAAFTPRNGIFQGDSNTKLLLHLDGDDAQIYTEDWSGGESFTNGEEFHNDAILATSRLAGAPLGFTGNSHRVYNATTSIALNKDFIAKEVVYLLTQQYPSLVIPGGNVNCEDDIRDVLDQLIEDLKNGSNSHMWDAAALYVDRTQNPVTLNHIETEVAETIWAYNKVDEMLQYIINNVAWTVQGNHGLTQTLNTDATNIYETGSADLNNCADVYTTINNLIDILTDTLSEANTPSATPDGDHLGTITKVEPAFEFVGGTVDAFYQVPFNIDYTDNPSEIVYTNQIDEDSRYRFFDAAGLIRANRAVIVDKASADLISRYPDLAQEMPGNEDGDGSGTARCKTDLGLILDEIAKDIEDGGNVNSVAAAKFYLGANDELIHIRLQVFQSVYAHERLGYYAKQAITGDLDYTNTDNIIVGDWGITDDPGGCANVQTAIDTLITTINDIIAPTGSDYAISADRLYFNRDYIAEEITGITDAYLTYTLNNIDYVAYNYDSATCQRDLKYLIVAIISDLQTGGSNSTINNMEFYLNSDLTLNHVESDLLATVYAIEQLKTLGEKAIKNLLFTQFSTVTGDEYAAQYTDETAYRDILSLADAAAVVTRFNELVDIAVNILAPGGTAARSASKNIQYNKNYYVEEISTIVNSQFGADTWQYTPFIETLVENTVHDIITTDVSKTKTAYNITIESVTGTFAVGDTVTSSGTGTADVLEYREDVGILIVGPFTGTAWAAGDSLTSGANTATISSNGVSTSYTWYTEPTNVKALSTARTITSLIGGEIATTNLWTNPEALEQNWTEELITIAPNKINSPDNTSTADKLVVPTSYGNHYIRRDYSLTSYNTFDDGSIKFDSSNFKFDEGSASAETQTFTLSIFLKADEYSDVRFAMYLDTSQNALFDIDLSTGTVGTIFNTSGVTVDAYGLIPFGNGWFRAYLTCTFSFGFASLRAYIYAKDGSALAFTGQQLDKRIWPSDGSNNDNFGYSSGVADGKIVIGAPFDAPTGSYQSGSAYIFDIDGTNQIKLIPSQYISSYVYFGREVAIGEGKIAVGAEQATNTNYRQGLVYVYDYDGSNEIILASPVPRNYEYFGCSVAIGNGKIVVGAYGGYNAPYGYAGAVYVYDLDGNYERTIQPSDPNYSDYFGWRVAVGGGKIAASAIYDDDGGVSTGSVYIFDLDGTNQIKVNNSDAAQYDNFGRSLAIGNNKLAVGCFYDDDAGSASGSAYIYDLDGTNEVKVTASDAAGSDYFGYDVAIGNNKLVVGSPYAEVQVPPYNFTNYNQGKIYTYDLDGTNEDQITQYTGGSGADLFGYSVATDSSGYIIGGAPYDDPRGSNSGSMYIIDGSGGPGLYAWGVKLTSGPLDPYVSALGNTYYSSVEFNVKKYALDLLETYMTQALTNALTSPASNSNFYSYYDSAEAANYAPRSISALIRNGLNIIDTQLSNSSYYTTLTTVNGISVPTKTYGTRVIPVGIGGGLKSADFFYGTYSDSRAELESISVNEGRIVKVYKRFRIDGDITDGPFTMNETVFKQGSPTITGVVYGFHEDENFKYLDVEVTAGPWAITDTIIGDENSTSAQISAIEDRLHIIDLKGGFTEDIPFKGYTSGETATPTTFLENVAAVISNTGGTLTVDTESLLGTFEKTAVVYPESSRQYLDVSKYAGLDLNVGDRIASDGYVRLGVSIIGDLTDFTVGNRLYKIVNGNQDTNTYGIISELDLDNNYIYIAEYQGTISQGDIVGDYGLAESFPIGYASVTTKVTTAGAAAALVQDIRDVGLNKRLYLSDIRGTFDVKDSIKGPDNYRSVVLGKVDILARVRRAFKGFDGTQTTFDLTIDNGIQYLPDPEGHMLIFVNGVLQPPGATNAYTAFSDQIQFSEPPDLGASFTGFYVGKLRQLDDISFEFDSLRQSFNLRRNDIFYSLTLTDGVQSSTIRPENNIIISLNGVLQEPGVGFEIVGSRIIFSEIPRVGSTFVAFSYVGSEADVDAAEVVPPIETGDFIEIEGETTDREVALIESSNSLITFDYLGSVFGQGAQASAQLTNGYIENVQVTAGGSGYTQRPTVRLDSISGFDGQIRALVGVGGVVISNPGSGYSNPSIDVETSVPDDWTAPNLADYGEELVDPEILN